MGYYNHGRANTEFGSFVTPISLTFKFVIEFGNNTELYFLFERFISPIDSLLISIRNHLQKSYHMMNPYFRPKFEVRFNFILLK